VSAVTENLNGIKRKATIKVKLAKSRKLSFHSCQWRGVHPPALFSSLCGVFPFFMRLWLERIFLEWKEIISKYRVLKKNLKMNVIFTIRFRKKKTPNEVYSDS